MFNSIRFGAPHPIKIAQANTVGFGEKDKKDGDSLVNDSNNTVEILDASITVTDKLATAYGGAGNMVYTTPGSPSYDWLKKEFDKARGPKL